MRFDHLHALIADGVARMEPAERQDAGETMTFTRELEKILAKTYDIVLPESRWRNFVPVNHELSDADETCTYRQFEEFGEAAIVNNMADDFPLVTLQGKEFTTKIFSIGDGYQYSIQDLRRSAKTGRPLDAMKAMAARSVMERKLDALVAVGDTNTGLGGLLNASNIQSASLSAKTGNDDWATSGSAGTGATAAEVGGDVDAMSTAIFVGTKTVHRGDTLLLPTAAYSYICNTPQSPTFTSETIYTYLLKSRPWLKSIECWTRCDSAGSGGVGRALMFQKDPMIVEAMVAKEFEQIPPQARNMAFIVACHMRFGGVQVRYPKAFCYMDGVAAAP